MAWLVSEGRVMASVEVARDRASRGKGLLGRDSIDGALAIVPGGWVHTLGMRFAIDVAFVDADDIVVRTVRMRRWRMGRPVRHSRWIIEATAGAFERWGLAVGDHVEVRDGPCEPPLRRDRQASAAGRA